MNTPTRIFAVLTTMCMLVTGCSQQRKERYPFFPTHPVVTWEQLSDGLDVKVDDNYRILASGLTTGVFPTSLAVARVAAKESSDDTALTLKMKPEVDFLAWNSEFDDFRAVSEVFPVKQMAMNGADVNVDTLLTNAKALSSGTLLVYAEDQPTREQYGMRGVFYDVRTRRALASLHSAAYVSDPIPPDAEYETDEQFEQFDNRDPRLLAIRRFNELARKCLLELMTNDQSGAPVSPEGWIPDRPMEPVLWPPPEDMKSVRDPRSF